MLLSRERINQQITTPTVTRIAIANLQYLQDKTVARDIFDSLF